MNVLSLFDGMSCGRLALERVGIELDYYYASEIDKYAIQISKKNWPDIIHIGDVTKWHSQAWNIDLLIGGSPCQGFSFAGKRLNFDDPRSKLFFEYVRILNEAKAHNPNIKFLLENVMMKQEYQDVISEALGVKPIMINSALVSAQNRKRLYWTNIEGVTQPQDKGMLLKGILSNGYAYRHDKRSDKKYLDETKSNAIDANYFKGVDNHGQRTQVYLSPTQILSAKKSHGAKTWEKTGNKMGAVQFPTSTDRKSKTLVSRNRSTNHIEEGDGIRMLTHIECERLQTLPDNYTEGVSNTQRYKMIGNGWTVDVITHIFSFLKP